MSTRTPRTPVRPAARALDRPVPHRDEEQQSGGSTVIEFPETEGQARSRRRRRAWLIGGGVAALLVALVAVLYFTPLLAIRTIDVTGTDLLDEQRAEQLLAPLQERPLPQVGEGQVEQLLGGEAPVAEASVAARLPHTLEVTVTEHEPVAMVPEGDGQDRFLLLSAEGTTLATVATERAADYELPAISSAADVRNEEVFETITAVLGALPAQIRTQLESATAGSVDSVTLRLQDGRTVLWGNDEQSEQKATVLEALLNIPEQEAGAVQEFDVSTPHQPVTR